MALCAERKRSGSGVEPKEEKVSWYLKFFRAFACFEPRMFVNVKLHLVFLMMKLISCMGVYAAVCGLFELENFGWLQEMSKM